MTEPIELNTDGTVFKALRAVVDSDIEAGGVVRVALGAFLEGRNDRNRWALVITAARLVPEPIPDPPMPPVEPPASVPNDQNEQ